MDDLTITEKIFGKRAWEEITGKRDRGLFYLGKYAKGFQDTIEWNKDDDSWTPESKELLRELEPFVCELEERVYKIAMDEGEADIEKQLLYKPVNDYTVERGNFDFIIKDSKTGKEYSRGNVPVVKDYLQFIHKMQTENSSTTPVEPQEVKQPTAEDTGEEPF